MDLEAIEKVYRRYAPGYDLYFGAVLEQGRHAVIARMGCQPGDRILEVGVGTGLSLPLYPRTVRVTGIDISHEMLRRARARVRRGRLSHVVLERMNAEYMRFPDNSFDKVVAMYVVSVAPDPVRLVNEMRRVCQPGGEIYIVNHFGHSNPVVGGMERLLAPLSRVVGFRPNLSLEDFIRRTGVRVEGRENVNLFGYWTLLRCRNDKPG
jgi:phosphatidylethanolamine/phosphatidyl-N-methylethanolamine N-methyltransferase